MTDADSSASSLRRLRREPPPMLHVAVAARTEMSPRLLRLSFVGDDLRRMESPGLAASVRLLVPSPGTDELVVPDWNGNEFLLPDGSRPALRTFTPLRFDAAVGSLDLEIVRHPGGAVSEWAERAVVGAPAAISGPGRAHELDAAAERHIVLGDETAIPAIGQLLEAISHDVDVVVHIEVERADSQLDLPVHPHAAIEWHVRDASRAPGHRLIDAAAAMGAISARTHVWAAGEAASMQALRKHYAALDVPRSRLVIRGYWKPSGVSR